MVARVMHDEIEVMESRMSPKKYMKFYEDINDVLYALIDKNLI